MSGTRIAGVGVAIFIFFFFLAFCLLCCLICSRTKSAWMWYLISTTIFLIPFLVVFTSPKGDLPVPAEGYDMSIIPLTIIMTLICFGLVFSFFGMLAYHVFPTMYARPLRYDGDVLTGELKGG